MLMLPNDGSDPVDLFQGRGLLSPSIDPFDWVWTAEAGGTGLVAVSARRRGDAHRRGLAHRDDRALDRPLP